jgi:2-keto-3-deoxy-L-rhamnonate aldolase RhmA
MIGLSLRQRAMAGETVLGAMIFEVFTPGIARITKHAGAEFILYDMEHGGLSLEQFKVQAAIASGAGIVPMIRVPRGEYQFLARALDLGAEGVMIPMVESAAQARAIVEACRYPPEGRRGAAFGFAHDGYGAPDPNRTMPAMNARNLVIAQIETERGLAEVESIAATPGIDCLWVGHFDLTNFLGIPGQFDHKLFNDALDRIVAAGRTHKKALGFMVSDAASARAFKARGFNVIATGTEMAMLTAGMRTVLDAVRQ